MTTLYMVIGSIVRFGLTFVFAYLVAHRVVTDELAQRAINEWSDVGFIALTIASLTPLVWSVYQKIDFRRMFLAAFITNPGATENDVKAAVMLGVHPPVMTHPDEVPTLRR